MVKAHSKTNGHQTKLLAKDLDRMARQAADRAVALAEQQIGVSAIQNPKSKIQNEIGAGFGLPYSPAVPVAEPPQDRPAGFVPDWARGSGQTSVFSVPGTPIISGFLTDVGEYNPDLQGRAAVQVYEQMRRGDGQVEATLQALTLPVLSAKWDVVPGLDQSQRGFGRAKEIAAFARSNLFGGLEFRTSTGGWTSQSWEEVLRNALLMLPFGVSVHEDVYTMDGAMLRLRMLADLLPLTFYRWHVDEDGRTLLFLGQYGYRGGRFEQVSVPADKICVFSFRREGANFWGRSVLRPAYPHWYVKNQLYRIDAIASERNSLGVPVIILPPGYSKEDHDAAVNFVTQLAAHERTGVVLPNGTTFEILGIKGALKDLHPSIQHHNEQISMQALAMFMNLGRTESGSRALGREHTKFFMLSLQNVANKIAEQITNTTVRRLAYFNYGADAPCPRLVAANVQARALEDIVDALTRFAQVGLVVSDRPLRARIREDLALPPETGEDVVAAKGGAAGAPETGAVESSSASGL